MDHCFFSSGRGRTGWSTELSCARTAHQQYCMPDGVCGQGGRADSAPPWSCGDLPLSYGNIDRVNWPTRTVLRAYEYLDLLPSFLLSPPPTSPPSTSTSRLPLVENTPPRSMPLRYPQAFRELTAFGPASPSFRPARCRRSPAGAPCLPLPPHLPARPPRHRRTRRRSARVGHQAGCFGTVDTVPTPSYRSGAGRLVGLLWFSMEQYT